MAYLALIRHGQSEWNVLGLWTGQHDVSLTDRGREEARAAGEHLQDIAFDKAYTSTLVRAEQTLQEILDALNHPKIEVTKAPELNERDYGDYQGKNKWEIKDQIGEDKFMRLRREWDYPVPGGETLKDVHARVWPYYESHILPDLKAGKNIIITAHGNSLRALVKHLEDIAVEDIHELEIGTGEVRVYEIGSAGQLLSKEVRHKGSRA